MEVKLMISGVPKGESFLAPDEERAFLGTLYSKSKAKFRFDIRLRNNGKGSYVYYQYLVYNVVNDVDGRPGSYFGLTLRLDKYCSDYRSIYNVLDMIFRKNVVGNLLSESNNCYIYTCYSFEKSEETVKRLENNILSMLGLILSGKDIAPLKNVSEAYETYNINFGEATDELIRSTLDKNKICSLSEEYESKSVKKAISNAYEEGARSRQKEIDELNATNKELQSKQIVLTKNKDNPVSVTNKTQPQSKINNEKVNEGGDEDTSKMTKYVVSFFGLVLTLGLVLYIYFLKSSEVSDNIDTENISSQNSTVPKGTSIDQIIPLIPEDSSMNISLEGVNGDVIDYNKKYKITINSDNNVDSIIVRGGEVISHDNGIWVFKASETTSSIDILCLKLEESSVTLLQKRHLELRR